MTNNQIKKKNGRSIPSCLSKKNIGVWHNISSKTLKRLRGKKKDFNLNKFVIYLKNLGYHTKFKNLNELRKIIKIFQMRFRPELINGKIDKECLEISKSILKA